MSRRFPLLSIVTAFAVILAAGVGHPSAAASAADIPVLTAAQYAQRLDDAEAACLGESEPGAATSAASGLLPIAVCMVQMPDGTLQPARNLWLIADIRDAESETNKSAFKNKIAAAADALDLQSSLTTAKPAAASARAAAADSARKLLMSDLYGSDPVPPPSGLEAAFKRFLDWLSRRSTPTKGPSIHWPSFSIPVQVWQTLLIILGIAAAAALVWLIVRLIINSAGMPSRRKAESLLAMSDEEAELVATRDFDKLLELAHQRAAEGDHRSAFRLVYLSTLVTLDTAGLVRLVRSRTNWEYLRALRSGPNAEFAAMLRPMTIDFDRIWYGSAPAGPAHFESGKAAYQEIKAAAARRAAQDRAPGAAGAGEAAPAAGGR